MVTTILTGKFHDQSRKTHQNNMKPFVLIIYTEKRLQNFANNRTGKSRRRSKAEFIDPYARSMLVIYGTEVNLRLVKHWGQRGVLFASAVITSLYFRTSLRVTSSSMMIIDIYNDKLNFCATNCFQKLSWSLSGVGYHQ